VPTLVVERFAPPTGGVREARERAYLLARVADELAGRTVWCAAAMRAMLDRMLRDRAAVRAHADALVAPDDIVVLDDPRLAPAIRERGAHAVVRVRRLPGARTGAVDAYVIGWVGPGPLMCHLAAVMPRSGMVAEKDMGAAGDERAWGSLLADVVDADRNEHVGGRRHVRPAVAVR
jgi:hypothetical protein